LPPRIAVEVVPAGPEAAVVHGGAAAGRAIVDLEEREVVAPAHVPVVDPGGVRVDVAAAEQPITVEVPLRVLVEVDHPAAEPLVGRVAANLQPVAHVPLLGAPEEAEIVDLEARRLEADIRVEADVLAADLADAEAAGAAVERAALGVERRAGDVRALEIMAAVFLHTLDRLRLAAHAAADHVAGEGVARLEP